MPRILNRLCNFVSVASGFEDNIGRREFVIVFLLHALHTCISCTREEIRQF